MQFQSRGEMSNVNETCTDVDKDLRSPTCGSIMDISDDGDSAKVRNYSFDYNAGSKGTICSSLALLKLESSSKNSFTMKGWLSENKIIPGKNALVIYAEVYNRLDRDVKVEARISGPGLEDFRLDLRDNGNGDPDIIKGDSIYSRYFTSFSQKGTYTVSIVIQAMESENITKENFTDSELKVSQTKDIGTFRVIETPPEEDILPPNRVCDLKVISINSTGKTVEIQWTAPGDNYDYGNADAYKVYFTEDWKTLDGDMLKKISQRSFDTSKIKPKMSGNEEKEMFQFPEKSLRKTFFIALKAIDKNENEGKISNIIQATLLRNNLLINNLTQHNDTENSTDTVINYQKDTVTLKYTDIYLISGVGSSIIFLIIVINILLWIFCFRKYKKRLTTTNIKDEYGNKRGNDINSDENILQSEKNDSQMKAFTENQETRHQNTDSSNPMLMYAKVQKTRKNEEQTTSYINRKFKPQEISHHKENDLGFV